MQRRDVCKLIDPNKDGSKKMRVSDALAMVGLPSEAVGGPQRSAVSHWLKQWREGKLQHTASSTQIRAVTLAYPEIDEYMQRIVEARVAAVGIVGFGSNSLSLRAKAEERARELVNEGHKEYEKFQASKGTHLCHDGF